MTVIGKTPSRDQPTLLLVDDDEIFCQVLQRALQKRGFEVHTAQNLQQADEIALSTSPEYAVVDLRIGQESGLTMVARLKSLIPDVRILILTGYASIATAVEAIKLGAIHYLAKPADADEIVAGLH